MGRGGIKTRIWVLFAFKGGLRAVFLGANMGELAVAVYSAAFGRILDARIV
jgi:hypothetical protein